MKDNDIFEIALRIKGDSDYCTFEIDADTDLNQLENLICDMLSSHFECVEVPEA